MPLILHDRLLNSESAPGLLLFILDFVTRYRVSDHFDQFNLFIIKFSLFLVHH